MELEFDVRICGCSRNFFGGRKSGIHPFLSRRLPDYFYEYKATKKTIKLKLRKSACCSLCVTKYGQAGLYDFCFPQLNFISLPKIKTLASLSRF
ncbi:MAG: hypothetical protein WA977_08550 [Halobacteriota archaeon]